MARSSRRAVVGCLLCFVVPLARALWPPSATAEPATPQERSAFLRCSVKDLLNTTAEFGLGVHSMHRTLSLKRLSAASKAEVQTDACYPQRYAREFVACKHARAIAVALFSSHPPWTYGHIYYEVINGLYSMLARPQAARLARAQRVALARQRAPNASLAAELDDDASLPEAERAVDVYVAAGAHLDRRRGEAAFAELEALFPEWLTGFRIRRAPWVPLCRTKGACVRVGTAPAQLRPELALVLAEHTHLFNKNEPGAFRASAWRALGVGDERGQLLAPPDLVTFVSTRGNSNGRSLANEAELVNATRDFFKKAAPQLGFALLEHAGLSLAEELRVVARSAVLITLFGSAAHNCRFLPGGAILVQLHGALKNEWGQASDGLYYIVCATGVGVRWVPYRVPGSIPLQPEAEGSRGGARRQGIVYPAVGGPQPDNRALVDPQDFVGNFLPRVLRGEWQALFREFEDSRRTPPELGRGPLPPLPPEWKRALPPQYSRIGV